MGLELRGWAVRWGDSNGGRDVALPGSCVVEPDCELYIRHVDRPDEARQSIGGVAWVGNSVVYPTTEGLFVRVPVGNGVSVRWAVEGIRKGFYTGWSMEYQRQEMLHAVDGLTYMRQAAVRAVVLVPVPGFRHSVAWVADDGDPVPELAADGFGEVWDAGRAVLSGADVASARVIAAGGVRLPSGVLVSMDRPPSAVFVGPFEPPIVPRPGQPAARFWWEGAPGERAGVGRRAAASKLGEALRPAAGVVRVPVYGSGRRVLGPDGADTIVGFNAYGDVVSERVEVGG